MQMLLHNCVAGSIKIMFNISYNRHSWSKILNGIASIEFPMHK